MSVRTLVKSIQNIMRQETGVDGDAPRPAVRSAGRQTAGSGRAEPSWVSGTPHGRT